MAKNKKSFILYCDQKEMFEHLPPELCKQLLLHLFSYVNDENPDSDDPILNALFAPIKHQLKRDLEKWESNVEQRRQAGIKSAEARKAKANEKQRPLTTVERDSTKSTDTVNVIVNDIKKKYTYNQFYDEQLELSEHHKGYEIFIKWIFGDNYLARPLVNVLKMREQMDFNQYKLLEIAYLKLKNNKSIEQPKIQELLVELEDWVVKDTKNYKRTLAGMIRTFMKGNTKKIKTW